MRCAAAVLLLAVPCAGQQTEQERANLDQPDPPMFNMANVTFNLQLAMDTADKSACYMDGGEGVWDRMKFRMAIRSALNMLGVLQRDLDQEARTRSSPLIDKSWALATPYSMSEEEMWTHIRLDRVVESSKPFLSTAETCGANPDCYFLAKLENPTVTVDLAKASDQRNFWNVFLRVTLIDVPAEIADNFRPFLGALTGYNLQGSGAPQAATPYQFDLPGFANTDQARMNSGTYSALCPHTQYLFNSFWISTEENFLPNRLEPVIGRGRKDTVLLVPLIMGLAFMLAGPIMVVAVVVMHQEQINDFEAAMKAKEAEIEKKKREEAVMEDQMGVFKKAEAKYTEEAAEKLKKKREDHEYEIDNSDINWGQPPAK